jgi:hypothetical protein
MRWHTFIGLHLVVVAIGAAGLWWFVFPAAPAEAIADTITAAATAGYAELAAVRMGWWR